MKIVLAAFFASNLVVVVVCSPAMALTYPFTESFTANAAGWTGPGSGQALAHSATGGVDDGGFISHLTGNIPVAGSYMNPTQGGIAFRATPSASAGAFAGDWITAGITTVQAYVQHDYDVAPIEFYVRLTNGPAVVFFGDDFVAAGDDWTLVNFEISPSNATFAGGTFEGVLPSVQNFMIGARIPSNLDTQNTPVVFQLDQVRMVPEPSAILLAVGLVACGIFLRRQRVR